MKNQYVAHKKGTSGSDFNLINEFFGYNTKEDQTKLPDGWLVNGSQNVLVDTQGNISSRLGYEIDGQEIDSLDPVVGWHPFITSQGAVRQIKVAGGIMYCRFVAEGGEKYFANTFNAGDVYWVTVDSSLGDGTPSFVTFYRTSDAKRRCLFVNEETNIKEWTGGIAVAASYTSNTIVKSGAISFLEEGFSATGSVLINGTTYTYTGSSGTTLTGVIPDPSAEPVNSLVIQTITQYTTTTGLPTTIPFKNLGVYKGYLFVSLTTQNEIYMSKVGDDRDFSFSSPRIPGQGATATLDIFGAAFVQQEDAMYITGGKDFWYKATFNLQSNATSFIEDVTITPLKSAPSQAAISQNSIFNSMNSVMFINNEPALTELGRILQKDSTPQTANVSDPIKPNFDAYDMTNASGIYWKYNDYIAVPNESLVLIRNTARQTWEAPQTIPVTSFFVQDNELYGHSNSTPNTYKLFTGTSDNGNPINSRAVLSYSNYGTRALTKNTEEVYTEGYIQANTTLNCIFRRETGGCAQESNLEIKGNDTQFVCAETNSASLGKESLGKNYLGGTLNTINTMPKFRKIHTFTPDVFYECQFEFYSNDIAQRWTLLSVGLRVVRANYDNNDIKQ